MGSMINLAVGRLEVDWGKNTNFSDHSPLFQPSDLCEVPYYYIATDQEFDEEVNGDNLTRVLKEGLAKRLPHVVDRINLLGHTMECARREFDYLAQLNGFDVEVLSFDQLGEALATTNVVSMSADYGEGESFGKFFRRHLFEKLGLEAIVDDPHYVQFNAGAVVEQLSAYTILQLVALNPSARNLPVSWQFSDIESEGWADRDQFVRSLDRQNRFLIVTEGSSDARVIRHALQLLKPHIADFFDFVDMNEGYPFTGSGSLYNFTKGLISISVQNNVVILYDNDAEGVYGFNRTTELNVPNNMRVLKLPDLPSLQNFRTIGASDEHRANINGRAAAIECYLDVGELALVRWRNFHEKMGIYHGSLVNKRAVMQQFLAKTDVEENYDFSKIAAVLEMIVSECIAMSESAQLAGLRVKGFA